MPWRFKFLILLSDMKPFGYDTRFMNAVRLIFKASHLAEQMRSVLYVGFSGGKDSQCVYHLTKSHGIPFAAHHMLTTVEPPELIHFIREYYPDVETIRQPLSMSRLIRKKKCLPTRFARYCCTYYKELKYPKSVVMTGIRREESFKRSQRSSVEVANKKIERRKSFDTIAANESIVNCVHGNDQLIVNPIFDWTAADVDYYLNEVARVPKCSLYHMGFDRVGCILCPLKSYKQRVKDMKRWPKYYDMYLRALHRVRSESNYFSDHPELTDEQVMDWWLKDVSLDKWLADNVQQLTFNFL